jgi:putative transposase
MRNDFNFDADLSTLQDGKNLTDLKNRGLEVILTACIDGITGFPNVIISQTEVPLCVIHPINTSIKIHGPKNQKELIADLQNVYKAETIEETETAHNSFEEKWSENIRLSLNYDGKNGTTSLCILKTY